MIKNLRQDGVWVADVYLRLSKEDGRAADESDSIKNQRDLILDFIQNNPDIRVAHILSDDGFTGANFDRGAFRGMIRHIENGEVNCVVVKDFSRLSRDHIGAGRYIERYFVAKNVRFISVNDRFDGLTADMTDVNNSLIVPFKNIMSEAFLEDISTKTKSAIETKRRNGELVCNFAVYGYVKDGGRLVVDEYAADVVRGIFDRKLAGFSDGQIAALLNAESILSPAEYKKSSGVAYNTPFSKQGERPRWTVSAVKRILTNRVYIGALEQGKRTKQSYRMKKFFYKPREAWSVHEDDHEPIIAQADFELVQELLAKDTRVSTATGQLHLFSGFIVCGGCGQPMIVKTSQKRGKRYVYYICATHKKYGNCENNNISADSIERLTLLAIQNYIAGLAAADLTADFGAGTLQSRKKAAIEGLIDKRLEAIRENNGFIVKAYEHWTGGVISEADYNMFRDAFRGVISEAEGDIGNLRRELERVGDNARAIELIEQFKLRGNIAELDRRVVARLIESVTVNGDKTIDIRFRYDIGASAPERAVV
jgi:DNA invertase Pin-like site-specific DNA recombinase